VNAVPSGDELAAIAGALASLRSEESVATSNGAWTTAARYPELEFDDLHALVRRRNGPCSTRS
jgi:hypothetical protein